MYSIAAGRRVFAILFCLVCATFLISYSEGWFLYFVYYWVFYDVLRRLTMFFNIHSPYSLYGCLCCASFEVDRQTGPRSRAAPMVTRCIGRMMKCLSPWKMLKVKLGRFRNLFEIANHRKKDQNSEWSYQLKLALRLFRAFGSFGLRSWKCKFSSAEWWVRHWILIRNRSGRGSPRLDFSCPSHGVVP